MDWFVFFAGIVMWLGLAVGALLALVSPEEMKDGKKYFERARWAVLLLTAVGVAVYGFWIAALVLFCPSILSKVVRSVVPQLTKKPSDCPMRKHLFQISILAGIPFVLGYENMAGLLIIYCAGFLLHLLDGTLIGSEFVTRNRVKKDTRWSKVLLHSLTRKVYVPVVILIISLVL